MNMPESIKNQIAELPRKPGVYFFKDKTGEILYVGKATSLRDRVRSYWARELNRGAYIIKMVSLVDTIDHQICDSPLEALILEANYIKHYLPKYNIQFKDDKSFFYVKIDATQGDGFSKVTIVRKSEIMFDSKDIRYFGPYSSGKYLRKALNIIRHIFTFRSCENMPKRPCLQYYIKNCPAPCAGYIEKANYDKSLKHVIDLLEGKKDKVVTSLKSEMESLAKKKKFEEASRVRDQYLALQHLKHSAKIADFDLELKAEKTDVPHRIEGYDVSNLSGKEAVVSMVTFIDGKPRKSLYKKFKIREVEGADDYGMLREAVSRRFSNRHFDSALFGKELRRNLVGPETDGISLRQLVDRDDNGRDQNDNNGGQDDNGANQDDGEIWGTPDLIIIDGGKGQVNAVKSVLMAQNIEIEVIGIAKGPTRKKEDLYLNPESKFKDVAIIRAVRDEAHRFAIAYHRQLRAKNVTASELDSISGIGRAKKQILLQKFKSVDKIKNATIKELSEFVGKNVALKIKELSDRK